MIRPVLLNRSYRDAVFAAIGIRGSDAAAPPSCGYYPLQETAGTVINDACGYNNGSYTATPTLGAVGGLSRPGTSVTFNGTTQYATMTQITMPLVITWMAWVKVASTPGDAGIFGQYSGAGSMLYMNSTLVYMFVQAASINVAFPTDGRFHFYTGTVDGATIALYIDGSLAVSTGSATVPLSTARSLEIATYSNATGGKFPGSIAHAAWAARALAANEIANLYRIGRGF